METRIMTRHFEPLEEFKEAAGSRINSAVEKYFRNVLESDAVFSRENNRYAAEVNVKIKGSSFHAHDEDHDLHQCLEKVLKKIETQMRRFKDKKISLKKKQKRSGGIDENS